MKKPTAKTKAKPAARFRPASPEMLTAWARADTLKKKAQYGKNHDLDEKVTDLITATFAGSYPLTDENNGTHPNFNEEGEQTGESEYCVLRSYGPEKPFEELARQLLFPPELVPFMLGAILNGDAKTLRNLAAAVERVHARAEVTDGNLTFKPAKPDLAKLAKAAIAGGKSGEEIADGTPYTTRHARRIAQKVGVPPKAKKWQN